MLASCSGQRKFNLGMNESDDQSDDEDDDEDDDEQLSIDNSLKLWHVPGTWETYDAQLMQTESI